MSPYQNVRLWIEIKQNLSLHCSFGAVDLFNKLKIFTRIACVHLKLIIIALH